MAMVRHILMNAGVNAGVKDEHFISEERWNRAIAINDVVDGI
jgi:hypothetical protein